MGQLGAILLEPMERAELAWRNLTDISNGYLRKKVLSAKNLLVRRLGPLLQQL